MSLKQWLWFRLDHVRMDHEYRALCKRLRRKANAVALLRVPA